VTVLIVTFDKFFIVKIKFCSFTWCDIFIPANSVSIAFTYLVNYDTVFIDIVFCLGWKRYSSEDLPMHTILNYF